MALNLTNGYTIASNAGFRGRVAIGMYFVAREVLAEDWDGNGRDLRREFANHIASADPADLMNFSGVVITDPTIVDAGGPTTPPEQVPDGMILAAIRDAWSALANANLTTNGI